MPRGHLFMFGVVACGAVCLAVDQVSKRLARHARPSATRVRERRAWIRLVPIWVTALVSAILLHELRGWFATPAAQFGLAAAFGGAAGNLLDMLEHRAVIDFIDLRWWPRFNLADVAIVAGLSLALWQG